MFYFSLYHALSNMAIRKVTWVTHEVCILFFLGSMSRS